MAKPLKEYAPVLQLVLLVIFFGIGLTLALLSSHYLPLWLNNNSAQIFRNDADRISYVLLSLKIIASLEPILSYLIPAFLFTKLMSPNVADSIKLNKSIPFKPAILTIVILIATYPVLNFSYDWNASWGIAEFSKQRLEKVLPALHVLVKMPNIGYLILNLIIFSLIAAIAKECFFRGVLQQILTRMLPATPWAAIILTAMLFSISYCAIFLQFQSLLPTFLMGIILGTIYYLTENIWLSVLGNFFYNGIVWVKQYFLQRQWSDDDPYHPLPTHWYTALAGLLLIAALLWYFRKSIKTPILKPAFQEDIELIGK